MFTGLITATGAVRSMDSTGAGVRLELDSTLFDDAIALGESVAVDGACLTVVEHAPGCAAFELAPETLRKTNFDRLRSGSVVNLERALRLGDRLGGHWVQGHVDGVGSLHRRELDGDWEKFIFRLPDNLTSYLVPRGSITVNGVSLTVVDVEGTSFSVALIPHTLRATNLGRLGPGDIVNLEVDILGKYVRRMLEESGRV
jgi:riboflavin synthase